MAEIDQGNPMMGEQPQITAFKGEQAITGALMEWWKGRKTSSVTSSATRNRRSSGERKPDLGL